MSDETQSHAAVRKQRCQCVARSVGWLKANYRCDERRCDEERRYGADDGAEQQVWNERRCDRDIEIGDEKN